MVRNFGKTSAGEETKLYIIKNQNNMEIAVSDYGASLVRLLVPDKSGQPVDVVLGYDDVTGYEKGDIFLGATVGRVANRIKGGQFELNGRVYSLTRNENMNTNHSGRDFFNKRLWETAEASQDHVTFLLKSSAGDQGYPGNVDIYVTYTLTEENEVKIHYRAMTDEDTLLNLTNHSYFNLSGHKSGTVLDQKVMICADEYTRADEESIPTGEVVSVLGTPMDFRTSKCIGKEIEESYEALLFGHGYDHNWVLKGDGMRRVASMYSEETGICMEVYTDLPGMQFYAGNFIEKEAGKEGALYKKRYGACFETQYFPDAIHKDNFKTPVVQAGETYDTSTVYAFRTG